MRALVIEDHPRIADLLQRGLGEEGFVVDVAVFNALRYAGDPGPLEHKPLTAKAISVAVATCVTYLGNRHWTWKHRERRAIHREYVLFAVLNLVGLVINLAILAFVNYVLDLRDPVSNNVANLAGIALGTLMRFWSYRRFVFRPELEDIVISGGDAYQLRAEQITQIGETLLSIDHVRRMRYATKGPAVMPQKILTDDAWTDALTRIGVTPPRAHPV